MSRQYETQVMVVGAGPVGLTLAIDLAQRGVKVLVAETRHRGEPPAVKCNHVSARTMEIWRRLGLSQVMRNTGLPEDYPNDVAYRTRFVGDEISRIPIPCRRDRYTATGGPDTWWPTPEPPHRINQLFLEPVLFEFAAATPGITILNRTMVDTFHQDSEAVVCEGVNLDSNERLSIRSDFLIGCDGGKSAVRKWIGAKLSGTDVVGRVQSTFFRAPSLIHEQKHPPAWATFSINASRSGNVYAIDGKETWLLHNYLRPDEPEFESVDRDWAIREILGVGPDFKYEVISKEDWVGRRLVADKFREGRAFICGDAAHLWFPMAGYGMNAGIADAMNLSWQLSAYLSGWGGERLLDGYQIERQPITLQVSNFAMNHAYALQAKREKVPENIEYDTPEGAASRERIGRELYDLNVKQYCCGGLNFGYFYDQSPMIAYDGTTHPTYSMDQFTSSTVPGCRTPHVWLENKQSLYDHLGHWFTLLRLDPSLDTSEFELAAQQRGLPLKVLDICPHLAGDAYVHKLVLSRPDQHVAWRGNSIPQNILNLVDQIRGCFQ